MGYAEIFFLSKLSQATGKTNMDKTYNNKEQMQTARNADVCTYLEEV